MIGQGLNSLIPSKDPKRTGQSAPAQSAGNSAGRVEHVDHSDDVIKKAQSFEHPPVLGVEVTSQEREAFITEQRREEITVDRAYTMEQPNVVGVHISDRDRAEMVRDVAYHPIDGDDGDDGALKRAAGFSKKTALHDAIFHIEVERIKPNPYQPRKHFDEDALKDLTNSIREFGILQPLVVSKIETETDRGTHVEYQLIAGERRLMASKRAGLERVPVIIRQAAERAEQLELAIIENLQRENLDVIESARSYARLQDEFGMTQREVAVRLGKSREVIGNALRLLSLPVEIQDALARGQINESQARLLLSVSNITVQKQLFSDLLAKNFSVRELKAKIKSIHNPPIAHMAQATFVAPSQDDLELRDLQHRLKDTLGTDVRIDRRGEGGKIIISFYSPEELYGVVRRINPGGE